MFWGLAQRGIFLVHHVASYTWWIPVDPLPRIMEKEENVDEAKNQIFFTLSEFYFWIIYYMPRPHVNIPPRLETLLWLL